MKINTDDLISVTDVSRRGVSGLIAEAEAGRTFVVMRQNKPAAVITGLDQFDRLQRMDELADDLRLWALALTRVATDDGTRYTLDEVAAEFGIDLVDEDD